MKKRQKDLLKELNKGSKNQQITLKTLDILTTSYLQHMLGIKKNSFIYNFIKKIKVKTSFPVFSKEIIDDIADKNLSKAKKYHKDKIKSKKFLNIASSFNADIKNIRLK